MSNHNIITGINIATESKSEDMFKLVTEGDNITAAKDKLIKVKDIKRNVDVVSFSGNDSDHVLVFEFHNGSTTIPFYVGRIKLLVGFKYVSKLGKNISVKFNLKDGDLIGDSNGELFIREGGISKLNVRGDDQLYKIPAEENSDTYNDFNTDNGIQFLTDTYTWNIDPIDYEIKSGIIFIASNKTKEIQFNINFVDEDSKEIISDISETVETEFSENDQGEIIEVYPPIDITTDNVSDDFPDSYVLNSDHNLYTEVECSSQSGLSLSTEPINNYSGLANKDNNYTIDLYIKINIKMYNFIFSKIPSDSPAVLTITKNGESVTLDQGKYAVFNYGDRLKVSSNMRMKSWLLKSNQQKLLEITKSIITNKIPYDDLFYLPDSVPAEAYPTWTQWSTYRIDNDLMLNINNYPKYEYDESTGKYTQNDNGTYIFKFNKYWDITEFPRWHKDIDGYTLVDNPGSEDTYICIRFDESIITKLDGFNRYYFDLENNGNPVSDPNGKFIWDDLELIDLTDNLYVKENDEYLAIEVITDDKYAKLAKYREDGDSYVIDDINGDHYHLISDDRYEPISNYLELYFYYKVYGLSAFYKGVSDTLEFTVDDKFTDTTESGGNVNNANEIEANIMNLTDQN